MANYPERKFPGHFAGGVIPYTNGAGMVQFLVIGVLHISFEHADNDARRRAMQVKFPGGCGESREENANPTTILVRELQSEIAAVNGSLRITVNGELYRETKRARSPSEEDHLKFFFACRVDGPLRQVDMLEEEGDELLSPPFLIGARALVGKVYPTHREPLIKALEALSHDNRAVAVEYADILAAYHAKCLWPEQARLRYSRR